jgi:hypothetical protein
LERQFFTELLKIYRVEKVKGLGIVSIVLLSLRGTIFLKDLNNLLM